MVTCGDNTDVYFRDGDENGPIIFNLTVEGCSCLALGGGGGTQ